MLMGDDFEVVEKEVNGASKLFIKGGRLKYYPTGMPCFQPVGAWRDWLSRR